MNNLVTIAVTCYNHEQYIRQCLESIYQQTHKNIQLIIVNDGSTDNSLHIIKETLQETPFNEFQLINQENKGLVLARNVVFEFVKGDFLLFVDSDNFLSNDFVEKLLHVANENDADIVYGNLINPANGTFYLEVRDFDLQDLFIGNFIDACSLIRTSVIREHRFDLFLNYKKLEDYDFFLGLILQNGAKAVAAKDADLYYRIIDDSMSARGDLLKHYVAYLYILNKYRKGYEHFIDKAMEIHFPFNSRLLRYNQKVTIYLDSGNGFRQEEILQFPLANEDRLTFRLPDSCRRIRVDLSESPSFYKEVRLISLSHQTDVLPKFTNAIVLGDSYVFPNTDPQMIYEIPTELFGQEMALQYRLFEINNIYSDEYIAKYLAQELLDVKHEKERLHQALHQYKVQYDNVLQKMERQREDLEEVTRIYNAVTHSRRWTIPTTIINFFRRKK